MDFSMAGTQHGERRGGKAKAKAEAKAKAKAGKELAARSAGKGIYYASDLQLDSAPNEGWTRRTVPQG